MSKATLTSEFNGNPLLQGLLPSLHERLFKDLVLPSDVTSTLHARVLALLQEVELQFSTEVAKVSKVVGARTAQEAVQQLTARCNIASSSPMITLPAPPSPKASSSPPSPSTMSPTSRVAITIGDTRFLATRDTWTAEPGSMIDVLISGRYDVQCLEDGSYYIDRDSKFFPYLLTYLRYRRDIHSRVTNRQSIAFQALAQQIQELPDADRMAVIEDGRYYGLQDFVNLFSGKEYIVMVGGYGYNSVYPVKTAEIFDPMQNDWEIHLPLSSLRGRFYTSAVVYRNKLYVIGGWDASSRFEYNVVECYEPDTESWTVVSLLPEYRMCHCCVIHEETGSMYIIGGATKNNQTLSTMWKWHIGSNVWTEMPSMKTARTFGAAVCVNDEIWVIGGEKSEVLDSVERYDVYTQEWTAGPSLISARRAHCAVNIGTDIYVLGGNADRGFHHILNSVEKLSTVQKGSKWSQVRGMTQPRSYFSGTVCNGHIYVVGGDTLSQGHFKRADTMEKYEPDKNTWVARQPIHTVRSGQACATIVLPLVRQTIDEMLSCPVPSACLRADGLRSNDIQLEEGEGV